MRYTNNCRVALKALGKGGLISLTFEINESFMHSFQGVVKLKVSVVLGILGPGQLGPGQLGPGARLSGAQLSTFSKRTELSGAQLSGAQNA